MPKRTDIKKIMVIGSGPIIIGQAAEFDYAGTQACLALKEEGYEVILANSNPATIMTDTSIADKVYMEPLTLEYVAKILRYERPDAIIPGIGGQTGLNLAMQLSKKGILDECQVELLGTRFESIDMAEDREKFKQLCIDLGEPVLPSEIAESMEEAVKAANEIGYPVVLRPAFTLGGTGGGFADNEEEFLVKIEHALALSPVHQVLVEKSVKGYQEIEFEVMRDAADNAIAICDMENFDPVGVHTGDSIVVAPAVSLTDREYQMLRTAALNIVQALEDRKAKDIEVISTARLEAVTDYFIVCSGTSSTHLRGIADLVEERMEEKGLKCAHLEGYDTANWILMDYLDVVVHILHQEDREAYAIEKFWNHAFSIPRETWLKESEEYSDLPLFE